MAGATEEGMVRIGETVALSTDCSHAIFTLNGTRYVYMGKPISVEVRENTTVDVTKIENVTMFTGKLSCDDKLVTEHTDFTSTSVILRDGNSEYVYVGAVNADGSFAIDAPTGSYVATFLHDTFMPVEVEFDGTGNYEVQFATPCPITSVQADGFKSTFGSSRDWTIEGNSITSVDEGRSRKYFDMSGSKFAVKTTIDQFADRAAFPMAGILLNYKDREFAFMMQAMPSNPNKCLFYFVRLEGASFVAVSNGSFAYVDGKMTVEVVYDGERLQVFVNKQLVSMKYGDLQEDLSERLGQTCIVGLGSVTKAATFRNFTATFIDGYVQEAATNATKCHVAIHKDGSIAAEVKVNGKGEELVELNGEVEFTISVDSALLIIDGKTYSLTVATPVRVQITKDTVVEVRPHSTEFADTREDIYG